MKAGLAEAGFFMGAWVERIGPHARV